MKSTVSFFKLIELYQIYTNDYDSRGTQQSFANQIKQERIELTRGSTKSLCKIVSIKT